MTLEAFLDNRIIEQVATTSGWCDFIHWTETLPEAEFRELRELADEGGSDQLVELTAQMVKALAEHPPNPDIRSIVEGMLEILQKRGDATVFGVTDGTDDDDDFEDDPDVVIEPYTEDEDDGPGEEGDEDEPKT